MIHKQVFFVLIVSFLCMITSAQKETHTETQRWVVTENSSLRVLGSTNVNRFTCDITGYNTPDTISIKTISQYNSLNGNVNLDIRNFNCHNPMMTKELRKTLKANLFPTLQIQFLSLNTLPELTMRPAGITGLVDIHLAGKCKRYTISYEVSVDANKIIHLKGYREISFSDFNLKPPKKAGGIITAKDKLIVEFMLNLKNLG